MPTIIPANCRPSPDPLSRAFFAADFKRVQRTHRTVQRGDPSPKTRGTARDLVIGNTASDDSERAVEWTEEDIVLLHWGLLRELRRLPDPETPLEEKLDTLAWALTEGELDARPFSMASCVRVVGTSPLSPTAYFGDASVEEIRGWIRANAPRWLCATLARYPDWVQQLVRREPDWVCRQLSRNPQWINEQVKLRATTLQQDLFGDQSTLLAY